MRLFPRFFVIAVLVTMVGPSYPEDVNLWSKVTAPAPGEAQSIGSYGAGCLVGAVALPAQGPGYRIMRQAATAFTATRSWCISSRPWQSVPLDRASACY
jgi:murein endopeptidase